MQMKASARPAIKSHVKQSLTVWITGVLFGENPLTQKAKLPKHRKQERRFP
jgi:hypothetical protein